MKHLLFVLAVMICTLSTSVRAQMPTISVGQVPFSNEPNSTVFVSTCVQPTVIAVSSSVNTQLDATLNTMLSSALGASYQRYGVQFQNDTSTIAYVGYDSVAISTPTFWKVNPGEFWNFAIGKNNHLYGFGSSGTTGAQLKVGGCGWKR